MRKLLLIAMLLSPLWANAQFTTHSFTIPAGHPRLWWNSARITQAQTWAGSNTPYGLSAAPFKYISLAWEHVVQGTDCSSAVAWAANGNQNPPPSGAGWPPPAAQTTTTAVGSDQMRTQAQAAMIVYDWCNDQWGTTGVSTTLSTAITTTGSQVVTVASTANMYVGQLITIDAETTGITAISGSTITANFAATHAVSAAITGQSQKAQFISDMNTWVGNVDIQPWGQPSRPMNNYSIGNLRNDLEWGIVSYGDNGSGAGSTADNFIDSALTSRWTNNFVATMGSSTAGVGEEGTEYSTELTDFIIPTETLFLGSPTSRDMADELNYFKAMTFWLIYGVTPAPTFNKYYNLSVYDTFNFADNEGFSDATGSVFKSRCYWANWLNWASNYWAGTGLIGKYARLQYNNFLADPNFGISNSCGSPKGEMYIVSLDSSPAAATDFTALPLDYYDSHTSFAYSKKAWDTSSAVAYMQFGGGSAPGVDGAQHSHFDVGNYTIWRNARWLDRETTDYSQLEGGTPGINSSAKQGSNTVLMHNTVAFTNVALGVLNSASQMMPNPILSSSAVHRLESETGYFYADVDMTGLYRWDTGHSTLDTGVVGHVEREMIYVRPLESLVTLDRVLTANQVRGGTATAASTVTSVINHCETNPTITDANDYVCTNGTQVANITELVPAAATERVINEASCTGCSAAGQFRIETDNSGAAQRYHLQVIQARDSGTSALVASVVDSAPADPTTGTFTVTLHPSVGSDTTIVLNKSLCSSGVGQCSSGGTINVAGAGAVALTTSVESMNFTNNGPVWGGTLSSLSPVSNNYGNVAVATGVAATFTLSAGTAAVHVSAVGLSGPNATDFSVTGGTCGAAPFTVGISSSCTIQVTFTPAAAGARSGSLNITDDSASPTAALSGTGTTGVLPDVCSITTPADLSTVDAPSATLSGSATAGQGTISTQFVIDGSNYGSAQSGASPAIAGSLTNGPHTLGCTCSDTGGGSGVCRNISVQGSASQGYGTRLANGVKRR